MAYCSRPDGCLCFFRQRSSDAAAGMLAENKPNTLLLGYPVASMDGPQNTFFTQLLTGKANPTAADIKALDAFGAIDANAPPAFLFATVKDRLTPYGVRAIVNAYTKTGVDDELHLFQFGPIVWAGRECKRQ